MNPTTDQLQTAPEATTELAHRVSDGFDILLVWDRAGGPRVVVVDARTGQSFELAAGDGKQALDAFYHPFAYAPAA
jgi:hypothetical protein